MPRRPPSEWSASRERKHTLTHHQGTVGLGFALVGLDLIYLGYLAALVSKHGAWGKDMYNTPERKLANADMNDKPPAH